MKLFSLFSQPSKKKNKPRLTVEYYKHEALIRQGREQFKALIKKGLQIPVALL